MFNKIFALLICCIIRIFLAPDNAFVTTLKMTSNKCFFCDLFNSFNYFVIINIIQMSF